MASYEVFWKSSARKETRKLPTDVLKRVLAAVGRLAFDPRPPGVRKLRGAERTYRLRVGDYRVVYSIYEARLVVEVVRVAHRREVYR
jgi:mRNA interferase RelE/StbE